MDTVVELRLMFHLPFGQGSMSSKKWAWAAVVAVAITVSVGFAARAIEVRNVVLGKFRARAPRSEEGASWELEGSEARMNGTVVTLRDLRLKLTLEDGSDAVVDSPFCTFDNVDKSLKSGKTIRIRHPAFSLDGQGYTAFCEEHRILVHSEVRMVIREAAMGGTSIFTPPPGPPSSGEKRDGSQDGANKE